MNSGERANTRRQARERALSLLYEAESKSQPPRAVLAELPVPPDTFACEILEGVEDHADELDALIADHARGWSLDRMPAIDRALLRMATFELAHRPDVPTGAAISEAVDLARRYSTEDSSRFVNGMLSAIAAKVRAGDEN
jgi:transcription antitermination protein NusB